MRGCDWRRYLRSALRRELAFSASRLAALRTVYSWFRRWLELDLFDALVRHVAVVRRRARAAGPRRGL